MSARTPTSEDGFQEGGIVIALTFDSASRTAGVELLDAVLKVRMRPYGVCSATSSMRSPSTANEPVINFPALAVPPGEA